MADERLFAADPAKLKSGGYNTGDLGEHFKKVVDDFVARTGWNSEDPPWGKDLIGDTFLASYGEAHTQLRDAMTSFAEAVTKAGDMTTTSGKNFESAQSDSFDAISTEGRKYH
ncbi:hypothetical protein OKJ48_22550 [Streptomyces kunmingensis]|uniref:WXG100 family type VII secretion target n=1 Tax=Streptomyces kunmingensis TaxID=68225 RepID=A0ABU6CFP3_9ACTN|nr:hypothetical protein [Streptomyces kunmingensis]MEB3963006.1 hypothetical protein [Streptomyces kunmingensis]